MRTPSSTIASLFVDLNYETLCRDWPGYLSLAYVLDYLTGELEREDVRTGDSIPLRDMSDVKAWLKELSAEARKRRPAHIANAISPIVRFPRAGADPCHDCGHVHKEMQECGEPIGGGRTCRCETRVTA